MEMAPQRKMNQMSSVVLVGDIVQITSPSARPMTAGIRSAPRKSLMPRTITTADASIRPKKNAHVRIG